MFADMDALLEAATTFACMLLLLQLLLLLLQLLLQQLPHTSTQLQDGTALLDASADSLHCPALPCILLSEASI
jgi:hypothetical protein